MMPKILYLLLLSALLAACTPRVGEQASGRAPAGHDMDEMATTPTINLFHPLTPSPTPPIAVALPMPPNPPSHHPLQPMRVNSVT
jgi:hypothetical protein